MTSQLPLISDAASLRVLPKAPPLMVPPRGYGSVVVDPPWPFQSKLRRHVPYETMTELELLYFAQGPLYRCAAADAHLWMWTVDAHLGLACQMIGAAGFRIVSSVPWVKTVKSYAPRVLHRGDHLDGEPPRLKIGGGYYVRHAHELCILAVRGSAVPDDRAVPSVIFAPPTEHSAKPEQLQDAAERIAPRGKPRLELFARRPRPGWTVWGNEVLHG